MSRTPSLDPNGPTPDATCQARPRALLRNAARAALLWPLFAGVACVPMDPGDGDGVPTTAPVGEVLFFSDIRVSNGQPLTFVYGSSTNATSVSAFYVPVEGPGSDLPTGPELTFAINLPTGSPRTVDLDTTAMPFDVYRIGVNLENAAGITRVLGEGSFEIGELLPPTFVLPEQNLSVVPGDQVQVRVNFGDPDNSVQWRLFVLPANESVSGVPLDRLGTQLAVGAANETTVAWNTGGFALDTYIIGASVTDTGLSIAQVVAAGATSSTETSFNSFSVTLAESPAAPRPPTVAVNQPASDRRVVSGDVVTMQFTVNVFEGPPQLQSVLPFFDFDEVPNSGDEVALRAPFPPLPVTADNVVFLADDIEVGQTAFLGVTADDALNPTVTEYARGSVTRDAVLEVTEPAMDTTVTAGAGVTIGWTTDLIATNDAEVDVFMQEVGDDGMTPDADEPEIEILAARALNTSPTDDTDSTAFDTTGQLPGTFQITVRVTYGDDFGAGDEDPLLVVAPGLLTIE